MNPRAHTEREELCPMPRCWDHCDEGEALCATHWGELPSYWRTEIRSAQDVVHDAPPGGDRIAAKIALAGVVAKAVESLAEAA